MKKITIEDVYKKLDYLNKDELDKIKEAYNYAKKVHKGVKREDGDAFINHPVEVSYILSNLNVDDITIKAALLHEVLNPKFNANKDEVKELFGSDVYKIIESLSKLRNLKMSDESESSAIYLRKVLVGLSIDPRVIYIKLADRLHNLKTIYKYDSELQKYKAMETMNVLVPIAHRLGINTIKSDLENTCLKILKPDVYQDILDKLNKTTMELNDNLIEMKNSISNLLSEEGIKHKIKGRVKSVYSIYNKLSNGKKWNEIYDILALRIFVEKESECYTVIGLIHSKYRPVPNRFKDYIANPKENMYQSIHTTVFGNDGEVYEIQVRTYEMDEIAEKGIASHWSYKEKGTKKVQAIMEQKLEMFRNILESNQDDTLESSMNDELLKELIYVFTPKGDVIELPKGSTPIDFAYRIHSKVGDKMTGCLVNEQMVPLTYELNNNDIVKVITNNSATPNKDWLNIVKTNQAKAKIKSYFSKQERELVIEKGKNILEKELRKRKLSFSEVLSDDNLKKIFKDLKLDSIDDLYMAIGSLRYTAGYIINLTNEDKHSINDLLIEKINTNRVHNTKDDVIVDGSVNILYNLAKCCKPVKGDEIVGFITKGDGVSIHKKDCPNVLNIKDRLIDVVWNNDVENTYLSDVTILAGSQNDIMDMIGESTKLKIQIVEMHNKNTYTGIECMITIKVKDKDELEHFKNTISKYKNLKVI